MKAQPLAPLFGSPRELLAKAARDLGRLDVAIANHDDRAARDAMLDAAISVYHVKDWIAALHPEHKAAAEKRARTSEWIRLCRDICHAGKHFSLDLERPPYLQTPQAVSEVSVTASAVTGLFAGFSMLKVITPDGREHYAREALLAAVLDWIRFLDEAKIDLLGD
jgi:hypothetical protein